MRRIIVTLCALVNCNPTPSVPSGRSTAVTVPPLSPVGPAAGFVPVAATIVAAGVTHSCSLRADGGVTCWGYNGHGQLGDGSRSDRLTPTAVKGIDDATSVGVGSNHSCALRGDATVVCWGANDLGQIGDGGDGVRLTATPVTGLGGVVQLSVRGDHGCALRRDGSIACWGSNHGGELGDASSEHRARPVLVRHLSDAVEIAVGWGHSCARSQSGAVLCWGENHRGELGREGWVDETSYARVVDLDGVAGLALGQHHSCALLEGGGVKCWGENRNGQLGAGYLGNPSAKTPRDPTHHAHPVAVVDVSDAVEIGAGSDTTCARLESGEVRCWGGNHWGELGGGSSGDASPRPVAVGRIDDASHLGIGHGYGCAVRHGGALWCWGSADNGQLGRTGSAPSRETLTSPHPALEVAAGEAHACLRDNRGRVFCWGANAWGQLGIGSNTPRAGMVSVPGLTKAERLAAGKHHTCAKLANGQVWCWGDDRAAKGHIEHVMDGELSVYVEVDGPAEPRLHSPVQVRGIDDAIDVSAGEGRSCATRKGGEVMCWRAADGRVVPIADLDDAVQTATGAAHSCARLRDGQVRCWGSNAYGRLGDGSNDERDKPVVVVLAEGGVLENVVEIAAGRLHTCARTAAGRVACWGTNFFGQLGDGTTMERNAAVPAKGVHDAAELVAGEHFTCVRHRGGKVSCWGENGGGQVGDGTQNHRLVPTAVLDLSDAVSLSGGMHYACAARRSRGVTCWGKLFGKPPSRPSPSPPRPLRGFSLR